MKKNFLFAMAMAAVFAGCSSDDDPVTNAGENALKGEGYVSLALSLPTTPTTRGANDAFADGTPGEYKVNNATLILFSGDDEANATFDGAYDLTLGSEIADADNDNITSSYQITKQISGVDGTKAYALVVLNHNSIFSVGTNNALAINTVPVTNLTESSKFSEVLAIVSDASFYSTDNFMMLNAPLSNVIGGEAATAPALSNVTTLAQIDKSKIYPTEAEAKANCAGSIFVERAVAKATLTAVHGSTTEGTLPYKIQGWALDNTNSKSYLVRNVECAPDYFGYSSGKFTPANYRFVGHTPIGETSIQPTTTLYRTYWAKDVNYADATEPLTSSTSISSWAEADGESPLYCKENTFNVANQIVKQTTRAVVKVQFNDGNDFYTVNDGNAIVTDYNASIKAFLLSNAQIISWLNDNSTSQTFDANDFDITMASDVDANGILKFESYTLNATGQAKLNSGFDLSTLPIVKELVNEYVVIRKYVNGMAYYDVLIKHFGDDLTPWNNWESTDKPSAADSYPGTNAEANYLGRYGMVRNNWYDLNVTSIKKIGSPVVPNVTTDITQDDDIDSYINVKINILSWAKRTQNVIL